MVRKTGSSQTYDKKHKCPLTCSIVYQVGLLLNTPKEHLQAVLKVNYKLSESRDYLTHLYNLRTIYLAHSIAYNKWI